MGGPVLMRRLHCPFDGPAPGRREAVGGGLAGGTEPHRKGMVERKHSRRSSLTRTGTAAPIPSATERRGKDQGGA